MKKVFEFAAILFTVCFLALLCAITAHAQDSSQITVAADSSSGTFALMLGQIISACPDVNIVQSKTKGGAPGNLDALVTNKVQAAFVDSDVFQFNSQADTSYNKYKTLVALYPDPIHIIVLRNPKVHSGWGYGRVQFNSLSDLKGYKIGAAGGGVYTARILEGAAHDVGMQFTAVDCGDGKLVMSALDSGAIQAAIFVGAAPLPNIDALPNKADYKIIPVGDAISGRLSNTYRPATITYAGMTDGPVHTMAPIALLLTRAFSTGPKVASQQALRNCVFQHLPELQDNGAPAWQSVDANDRGPLNNWYEIPSGTRPVSAPHR